jgi:2,3-bisphosphoglycerate-dependent phosphoglycerate mutase
MTHLYLIRHGEAISAVDQTIANTMLSPLGVTQAERLRDRLAATGEIRADVLISSTLLRARQTATIIAPALGLPIVFDDDIQEWYEGEVDGIPAETYLAPFKATPVEQRPFLQWIPSAESWVQFMLRACTSLNRITQEHEGKTIVIVCHGGIIDASFRFFLGLNTTRYDIGRFNPENTSITSWVNAARDLRALSWILESYNDVGHLRDLAKSAESAETIVRNIL